MFEIVENFENQIADFYGAPYAVATDSCTHAIELCLRYKKIKAATCPTHTYISIPFTFEKLNINWKWERINWKDFYFIGNTNIVDAAVLWKENSYIQNTLMCLSFQYKKHLSLGRGGMILCDKKEEKDELRKMSYDGRDLSKPWRKQNISTIGYHYYMTPETAEQGITKLESAKIDQPKKHWSWRDYPDLSKMEVFNEIH